MIKGNITLKPTAELTAPWSDVLAVALGNGKAQEYVLVEKNGVPKIRFDLIGMT